MAQGFHVVDYIIFAATLVVSLGIGIYYAMSGGGQKTTGEYLMGNRNLKVRQLIFVVIYYVLHSVVVIWFGCAFLHINLRLHI